MTDILLMIVNLQYENEKLSLKHAADDSHVLG